MAATAWGLPDATSSYNFSSPLGGSMIDPGTATLIGAGVSAIGSGVGGAASGKGAKSAAEQAREAAAEQAKQVTQANRETLLGTFGLENLAQQQEMLIGGPRERFKSFEDARFSSAMDASPTSQARARQTMAQNLAMRQAELGAGGFRPPITPPLARFV